MLPDDPRHGQYRGAQQHIRDHEAMCAPCRDAYRRYQSRHEKERKMGRVRHVPSAPAIEHIAYLTSRGMTVLDIAARSGVSTSVVQQLKSREPRAKMLAANRDAILGVRLTLKQRSLITSVGTRRRLQALAHLGWSTDVIAQRSGVSFGTLRNLLKRDGDLVTVGTARAVAEVYEALCLRFPPPGRGPSYVRNRAQRLGWQGPMAWDDIDDVREKPKGGQRTRVYRDGIDHVLVDRALAGQRVTLTTAERAEVARRWVAMGRSKNELERVHGIVARRYEEGVA